MDKWTDDWYLGQDSEHLESRTCSPFHPPPASDFWSTAFRRFHNLADKVLIIFHAYLSSSSFILAVWSSHWVVTISRTSVYIGLVFFVKLCPRLAIILPSSSKYIPRAINAIASSKPWHLGKNRNWSLFVVLTSPSNRYSTVGRGKWVRRIDNL